MNTQNLNALLNDSAPSSLLKIKINATQTKIKQIKKIALYSKHKGQKKLEGAIVWGISYE